MELCVTQLKHIYFSSFGLAICRILELNLVIASAEDILGYVEFGTRG